MIHKTLLCAAVVVAFGAGDAALAQNSGAKAPESSALSASSPSTSRRTTRKRVRHPSTNGTTENGDNGGPGTASTGPGRNGITLGGNRRNASGVGTGGK